MNKVNAIGRLIKTGRGEYGYASITVLIKRAKRPDVFVDFVLDTVLDPSIVVSNVVSVDGYIRGYNAQDKTGKWKIVQYFVATKVEKAKSLLEQEFGVEGHFRPDHQFNFYAEGTINSIFSPKNGKSDYKFVGIKIPGNREIPEVISVEIEKHYRFSSSEFEELQKGDNIVFCGDVRTPRKKVKGEMKLFENITLEDYVITNREVDRSYRHMDGTTPEERSQEKFNENMMEKIPSFSAEGKKPKKNQDNRVIEELTFMGTIPEKVDESPSFEETEE